MRISKKCSAFPSFMTVEKRVSISRQWAILFGKAEIEISRADDRENDATITSVVAWKRKWQTNRVSLKVFYSDSTQHIKRERVERRQKLLIYTGIQKHHISLLRERTYYLMPHPPLYINKWDKGVCSRNLVNNAITNFVVKTFADTNRAIDLNVQENG